MSDELPVATGATLMLLTDAALREGGGEGSFKRGRKYFEQARVTRMTVLPGGVRATVTGSHPYTVRLAVSGLQLSYSCDCYVGQGGELCKHCVAVAIAWREGNPVDDDDELPDVGRASRTGPRAPRVDPHSMREQLRRAIIVNGFLPWGRSLAWSERVNAAVDSLEVTLTNPDNANDVIELAEYALARCETSVKHIDDSSGYFGYITERLTAIHHAACIIAQPDQKQLAARMYKRNIKSGDLDIFHDVVSTHSDVLGDAGIAELTRLAERDWNKLSVPSPDDRYDGPWLRLERLLDDLARRSGDLDRVIEVLSRDLSVSHDYLQIAQACSELGDDARGIEWAQRGWKLTMHGRRDDRIRDYLVDSYARVGNHEQATQLAFDAFVGQRLPQRYDVLRERATELNAWPEWREHALACVREDLESPGVTPADVNRRLRASTTLARLYLHEDDVETAWSIATEHGAANDVMLNLVNARRDAHPLDAARLYAQQIESSFQISRKKRAYQEAVAWLDRARALYERAGAHAEFSSLIREIRHTHRQKRNFIALLDDRGW